MVIIFKVDCTFCDELRSALPLKVKTICKVYNFLHFSRVRQVFKRRGFPVEYLWAIAEEFYWFYKGIFKTLQNMYEGTSYAES